MDNGSLDEVWTMQSRLLVVSHGSLMKLHHCPRAAEKSMPRPGYVKRRDHGSPNLARALRSIDRTSLLRGILYILYRVKWPDWPFLHSPSFTLVHPHFPEITSLGVFPKPPVPISLLRDVHLVLSVLSLHSNLRGRRRSLLSRRIIHLDIFTLLGFFMLCRPRR